MTQKNETPVESKAGAETTTKTVPAKPVKTPLTQPELNPETEPKNKTDLKPEPEQTKTVNAVGITGELLPEMVELVTELRDTVKRLDPRKHTAKTLRRSLSNVSDILADIDKLYPQG